MFCHGPFGVVDFRSQLGACLFLSFPSRRSKQAAGGEQARASQAATTDPAQHNTTEHNTGLQGGGAGTWRLQKHDFAESPENSAK